MDCGLLHRAGRRQQPRDNRHDQLAGVDLELRSADTISPATLAIPAGSTKIATLTATSGNQAGDVAQSIVLNSSDGSQNDTINQAFTARLRTGEVDVYKDNPQRGDWTLTLDWVQPVSGDAVSQPFTGHVSFNRVRATANGLPSGQGLNKGQVYNFSVTVTNTGGTPQRFFLDPRLTTSTTYQLPSQNGSDQNMSLPLPPGLSFPFYIIPTDTSAIETSLEGSVPVGYDIGPFAGDPDMEADSFGNSAALDYSSGDEVEPGFWFLNPSEIGPYGPTGAPSATASADFSVVTAAFDPTVDSSTGDLWTDDEGLTNSFNPLYLDPGQQATIPLTITPSASHGTHVHGVINLDDAFQLNDVVGAQFGSGDELASFPFSYTVK